MKLRTVPNASVVTIGEAIEATCMANGAPIEFFLYLITLIKMSGGNPSLPCESKPEEFEAKLLATAKEYGFKVSEFEQVKNHKPKGN